MRKPIVAAAIAVLASFAAVTAAPSTAQACGGCFVPPENNTVVTDHRMVLSITPQQTTLYDQIRYQGSPESFAWVLPIAGEAKVGVSSNALFETLEPLTSTQVIPPPLNCPPPPDDCNARFGATSADSASGQAGGVSVLREEAVGPYQTVQLRSTDPAALATWLSDNGYTIPDDVRPVVDAYVAEKFDFLAIKLLPGKSVSAMKPIRVTTQGASPTLPLRMVTAGVAANVGVTLWVVGDGRWEPQNFANYRIENDEIEWDWATNKSNYTELRAKKNSDAGGAAWEMESSLTLARDMIAAQIRNGSVRYENGETKSDYEPVKDEQGTITRTADQVFDDDMGALLGNGSAFDVKVTRMRADLPRASLATDLALQASKDQGELQNVRQVTRERGEPQCPVWDGCGQSGTAPRSEAIAQSSFGGGGGGCSTPRSGAMNPGGFVLAGLATGLIAAMRGRRKK